MANVGQTINDRILAAKHSLAGQGLAKAVCKATTEELIGPKKKHIDYLLQCTQEPNVSIPTIANLLIERTQSQNWIVVFKSLVTIHNLMCYGNERFTQYLASSNSNFQLGNFIDKTGSQGYDMSPFVRRYAKYLSEKSVSYRTAAKDFCKVKRGKDGGMFRSLSGEKLLKMLPIVQVQLEALVDFDVTSNDLNNGVINAAFILLFRDLIRLFACYNDGIINLLEKYFGMNKKQAREGLDIYKKFLIRMDRVSDFLKVAEKFGIDKNDIPDLAKAPSSLVEALEAHLASLEGRKPSSNTTSPTSTITGSVFLSSAVNVLSSTNSNTTFGSSRSDQQTVTAQQLINEEEQALKKIRDQHFVNTTNPFLASAGPEVVNSDTETPNILDLFGMGPSVSASSGNNKPTTNQPVSSSDDLLQLAGNPFGGSSVVGPSNNLNEPTSSVSGIGASFFGEILQPQQCNNESGGVSASSGNINNNSNELLPSSTNPSGKVISGDLDASLANLTSNLNLTNLGAHSSKNFIGQQQKKGPPIGAGLVHPGWSGLHQVAPTVAVVSPFF